jgi:hypothetical protein
MLKITKETIKVFRSKLRYFVEPTILAEAYHIDKDGNHLYHVKLWYIPLSTIYQVSETKYDKTRSVSYRPDLEEMCKVYNRTVEENLKANNPQASEIKNL